MAGRGRAPQDPNKLRGHNKDHHDTTTIRRDVVPQPDLPPCPDPDGWCEWTQSWWKMWGESAQAEHFGPTDWDFLAETAWLHHQYWKNGVMSFAGELRLRVAKYGATPEDRARLRMNFADADDKDRKHKPAETAASPSEHYGNLKVVRDA